MRVGALAFPGFELLDLFGPLEILGLVEGVGIEILGTDAIGSAQGPRVLADRRLAGAAPDLLLIPGGPGTRALAGDAAFLAELAEAGARSGTIASVCTGAALLARAGLLDGRAATTNKLAFDWVASLAPGVVWRRRARWVRDGRVWTASGVSAGIDMGLALVADRFGRGAAEAAARDAEYVWNDDPDEDPFAIGGDR